MIVRVAGAELSCVVRGRGPLCLVPSAIGTQPYERQMPAGLDEHFTMVFVDLRGAGRSTGRAEDLDFDVASDDLDAVRAALGAERAMVIGHSILGALAIEHARRRPSSVSCVVTVGTPPYGDMIRLGQRGAAYFEANASSERKERLRQNLAQLPADASSADVMFAQTPMRFFDVNLEAAPLFVGAVSREDFFAHLMGTLTRSWTVTEPAAALTTPLLIAHGLHDYVVPWEEWQAFLPKLPTAQLRLFDRSGHHPFVDEPAKFIEVLREALAQFA